jgi:hypothetical protein
MRGSAVVRRRSPPGRPSRGRQSRDPGARGGRHVEGAPMISWPMSDAAAPATIAIATMRSTRGTRAGATAARRRPCIDLRPRRQDARQPPVLPPNGILIPGTLANPAGATAGQVPVAASCAAPGSDKYLAQLCRRPSTSIVTINCSSSSSTASSQSPPNLRLRRRTRSTSASNPLTTITPSSATAATLSLPSSSTALRGGVNAGGDARMSCHHRGTRSRTA